MHHKKLTTTILIFLAIGSISGKIIQKQNKTHVNVVTEYEPTKTSILETLLESFNSLVSDYLKLCSDFIYRSQKPLEAIIKKRDLDIYNVTKVVDDNKSMNEFYKEKFASKYLKKFGMEVQTDEENKTDEEIKEDVNQLKERLGNEFNETLVEYGNELKKLSGEFVELTNNLGKNLEKQYNELTSKFIKKVKWEIQSNL